MTHLLNLPEDMLKLIDNDFRNADDGLVELKKNNEYNAKEVNELLYSVLYQSVYSCKYVKVYKKSRKISF